MATDYKSIVNDLENDEHAFAPIYRRMDIDRNMMNLVDYVMMDSQNPPQMVPDIVNVTLNMPSYMATNILTDIGSASEQVIVESRDAEFDTHYVEDFTRALFDSANERNKKLGWLTLNSFTDGQLAIRGRAARRVLFRKGKDGKLATDIANWDTRFVTYLLGSDGLQMGAYHIKRSQDLLEAQYNVKVAHKMGELLDVWDKTHNEVWIEGNKVFEQEHEYGFTPVVYEIVALGSGGILLDLNNKSAEGESIFFMIRGIVPELNRLASIMQTLNLKAAKPPMQSATKEGGRATPADYPEMGDTIPVEVGGGITPINYGDAQRSAVSAQQVLQASFEAGGITATELGLLGQPSASGVALLIAGEGRDRIFTPRLRSKGNLNSASAKMGIKQSIQAFGTGSVDVGIEGYEETFDLGKLQGNYKINFGYSVTSQEVEAGRASLAAAYGNLMSDHTKRREVLHFDDPDGEEDLLRAQRAEQTSPSISKFKEIESLVALNRDFEAELLAAELGLDIDRLLAGEVPQPQAQPQQEDEPTQVLSLHGGERGRANGGNAARSRQEGLV